MSGAPAGFLAWGVVLLVIATAVVFGRPVQERWDETRQPRIALAAELDRLAVPATDRLLSIDAAGFKYWTGRPGVVTPDDPIETIEAVARAYEIRWLILERDDAAQALGPVLKGDVDPAWIGPATFSVPDRSGGAAATGALSGLHDAGRPTLRGRRVTRREAWLSVAVVAIVAVARSGLGGDAHHLPPAGGHGLLRGRRPEPRVTAAASSRTRSGASGRHRSRSRDPRSRSGCRSRPSSPRFRWRSWAPRSRPPSGRLSPLARS